METANEIINETTAGRKIFELVMDLRLSADKQKDAGLDFIARRFESAIADLWRELSKIEVKK